MFKIESFVFQPVPTDPDFRVTIRPLSFIAMQEVRMAINQGLPSGGPESETEYLKAKSNVEWTKAMFERAITKIEGITLDGSAITTWKELLDVAPPEVAAAILKKINEVSKLSETEKKN